MTRTHWAMIFGTALALSCAPDTRTVASKKVEVIKGGRAGQAEAGRSGGGAGGGAKSDAGPEANPFGHGTAKCLVRDGADCDLIKQCGCDSGQHCQARGAELRPSCVKTGDVAKAWGPCKVAGDCPHGQTCDRGSCRPYCESDADCDGGACVSVLRTDGTAVPNVSVCWKPCEIGAANACAKGTTCRSVELPGDKTGSYCTAPYDPCPTVQDGICDEQSGTKNCADGTDAEDCNCHPKLPGAPCDPVSQCGCDRSSTCEALSADSTSINGVLNFTARCTPPGTGKLHDSCSATSDCERGSFCNKQLGMCARYSSPDVGCEGDDDFVWIWNNADPKLGFCRAACDRQTGKPCRAGSVCAYWAENFGGFASKAGNYCTVPYPEAQCPHGNECDEPEGTGLCLPGADRVDCCKTPTTGGVCDPVKQCGCEDMPNTQCQHLGDSAATSCQPRGTQAPYSRCSSEQGQCRPGSACIDDVCRPYCHADTETDCGSGNLCVPLTEDRKGIAVCFIACDFMGENTCADGLVCQAPVATSAVCNRIYPVCEGVLLGNKRCDDTRPTGSHICELGGDPEDCGPVP